MLALSNAHIVGSPFPTGKDVGQDVFHLEHDDAERDDRPCVLACRDHASVSMTLTVAHAHAFCDRTHLILVVSCNKHAQRSPLSNVPSPFDPDQAARTLLEAQHRDDEQRGVHGEGDPRVVAQVVHNHARHESDLAVLEERAERVAIAEKQRDAEPHPLSTIRQPPLTAFFPHIHSNAITCTERNQGMFFSAAAR